MRRSGSVVIALCLLLSGCGGGDNKQAAGKACQNTAETQCTKSFTNTPFQFPSVSSDQVGVDPTVASTTNPPTDSQMKTLRPGTGAAVRADDEIVADFRGQVWETGGQVQPFFDTFANGVPYAKPVSDTGFYWTKKIQGVKVGSRVLIVMAPKDTFGIHPPPNSDMLPNDTLIFVVDVLGTFPRKQGPTGTAVALHETKLPTVTGTTDPKVTVPAGTAPTSLQSLVLVRGKGAKVTDGQWLLVQYTGLLWSDSKVFDSTWTRKEGATPEAIRMAAPGQLNGQPAPGEVPGVVKGLVGHTVGSRVLIVIPPGQGYGKTGLPSAGISGTDTLVFVIDILGSYRTGAIQTPTPTPSTN